MTRVPQPMAEVDIRRLLAALPAGMPVAQTVSGWATVELDRAEAALSTHASRSNPVRSALAPEDELLGARCRFVRVGDSSLLLLEPSTEGRLAASLARFGEGPIALYAFIDPSTIALLGHA
ncbi:MAG TPA: hypothetical protein VGC90_09635, partial [Candidatus Limnocylindrales bacterium]